MGLLKKASARARQILGLDLNYHVETDCSGKEHLGSERHGWFVCPESISRGSVLYSLGVGKNISFDLAMISKYNVQVYAFDPTPRSIEWMNSMRVPDQFNFFGHGIASFDGTAILFDNPEHNSQSILQRHKGVEKGVKVQFHRMKTVMDKLGHARIDILKMDIEGAEYEVIDDLLASDVRFDQLLIEFHHGKFKGIGLSDTRRIIGELHKRGFRIFYHSPRQREFSFIKRQVT